MNEMSYCREALRRLSGDGPVMVKSLTAWKRLRNRGHTEPAYNAGLMDEGQYRDGRGGIPPQTEQRKRRMLSGKINEAL